MDLSSPPRKPSEDHRTTSTRSESAPDSVTRALPTRTAQNPADRTPERQNGDVVNGGGDGERREADHDSMAKKGEELDDEEKDKKVRFDQQSDFLGAVADGDTQEVRRLVRSGVDPNTANADGLTALHEACSLRCFFIYSTVSHYTVT